MAARVALSLPKTLSGEDDVQVAHEHEKSAAKSTELCERAMDCKFDTCMGGAIANLPI
jgi:hypothetical protein